MNQILGFMSTEVNLIHILMKSQKSTKVFIVAGILVAGLAYLVNDAINTPLIQQFDSSARNAKRAAEESKQRSKESSTSEESLTEEQLTQRVENSRARLSALVKDIEQKQAEMKKVDTERESCLFDNSKTPDDCDKLATQSRFLLSQIKTLGEESQIVIASTYKDLCRLLPNDSRDFCGQAQELARKSS
jgi:hypothetical protein